MSVLAATDLRDLVCVAYESRTALHLILTKHMGACVASLSGPMPRRAEIVFNYWMRFSISESAAELVIRALTLSRFVELLRSNFDRLGERIARLVECLAHGGP